MKKVVSFKNLSVNEFVKLTGSTSPTPGGGSVAPLVASLGLSLVLMALKLSLKDDSASKKISAVIKKIETKNNIFIKLIDEDKKVFEKLVPLYKDKDDKKFSPAVINAILVPVKLIDETSLIINEISKIKNLVRKIVLSDFRSGVMLLDSAGKMSYENVLINLNTLTDKKYKEKIKLKNIKKNLNIIHTFNKEVNCD